MSEFQKYRRGLEHGTIERHDFGSKAGDPDWCYLCGEHRNHPAHAAKDAELAEAVQEIEWLKNLVGDPEGTAAHAEAFLARAERAEAELAEASKALEAIYTEARSLPAHTSAVTREHVLTSKLAVIRDAARRALEGSK